MHINEQVWDINEASNSRINVICETLRVNWIKVHGKDKMTFLILKGQHSAMLKYINPFFNVKQETIKFS